MKNEDEKIVLFYFKIDADNVCYCFMVVTYNWQPLKEQLGVRREYLTRRDVLRFIGSHYDKYTQDREIYVQAKGYRNV